MFAWLRRNLLIVITASVVSLVWVAGPTVAQAAYDAVNADKVDGKHAVSAGAAPGARAGKLVATDGNGRLPNNIIAKAPDASRLGGVSPAGYVHGAGQVFSAYETVDPNSSATVAVAGLEFSFSCGASAGSTSSKVTNKTANPVDLSVTRTSYNDNSYFHSIPISTGGGYQVSGSGGVGDGSLFFWMMDQPSTGQTWAVHTSALRSGGVCTFALNGVVAR